MGESTAVALCQEEASSLLIVSFRYYLATAEAKLSSVT
jgi:hypothetical protein